MRITRDNYEPYFIDLIDGTLPSEKVDELLDFLRENPDLAKELKELEKIKLQPDYGLTFNHQLLLKTEMDQPGVMEETCIRSIEHELSEKEEAEFQHYLSTHPAAGNEYRLFRATISEPDPFIVFNQKDSLFRNRKILPFWLTATSVAAVGLLAVLLWFSVPSEPVIDVLAQVEPIPVETPVVELKIAETKSSFVKAEFEQVINKKAKTEQVKPVVPVEKEPSLMQLQPLAALLTVTKTTREIQPNLADIAKKATVEENQYYPSVTELLALEVKKIDPREEVKKVGRFALDKIKDLSEDKLNYETASGGKINKIEYSSRLLAFSIPVNS